MDLHPGVVFGRYTIDAELGRGGMGLVMLATDSVLHRKVALKILLPGLLTREEIVARFFREARLAAQLTHPNTVHIYDLGEAGDLPFIAMEYVEGKPLTAYLGDPHIPAERRLRWLVDVARGLSAAHARGLFHRDMKPANVMVSKEGMAKVVDFGLAKKDVGPALSTRYSLSKPGEPVTEELRKTFQTAQGFIVGTPAYMAPEQLEAGEIDARADQFSWALTAYALMFGRNIRAEDPLLFGPIPLICDRVPGVSRRASEIVLRALSTDREMRFPTMDALIAELEQALSIPSITTPAAPPVAPNPLDPMPGSVRPTPRMVKAPAPPIRQFCPDCGLALGMSSPDCSGSHVSAFPIPGVAVMQEAKK